MSILSDEVYCIPVKDNINLYPGISCLTNNRVRRFYATDPSLPYQQWLLQSALCFDEMELFDLADIESWVSWIKKFMKVRKGMHFQISRNNIMYGFNSERLLRRCYINIWKYGARKKHNKVVLYSAALDITSDIAADILEKLFGDSKELEVELWQ